MIFQKNYFLLQLGDPHNSTSDIASCNRLCQKTEYPNYYLFEPERGGKKELKFENKQNIDINTNIWIYQNNLSSETDLHTTKTLHHI